MPRAKAAGPSAKKPPKVTKGHKLPVKFPEGRILRDVFKKDWRLGPVVGQGGFGLIYFASSNVEKKCGPEAEYVIKIEPHENGPLFCEFHFYQRAATAEKVDKWMSTKTMKYLGIPKYIAFGTHDYNGSGYRFLVLPRFGTDLQKLFVAAGKSFLEETVYALALRLIDDLEYLHSNYYVHADIKAANILLGHQHGKTVVNSVYLVDYGLASRYSMEGKHREYEKNPQKAHDGTIEFTSRDAHNGVSPSRRGDFEILGYCLLQWLCGALPWEDKLTDKSYVQGMKNKYMDNIPSLMKKCFPQGNVPVELQKYLELVSKLKYDAQPDYNKFRAFFKSALSKLGQKDEWILHLPVDGKKPSTPKKPVKRHIASPKPEGMEPRIKRTKVTTDSPLSAGVKHTNVTDNVKPKPSPSKELKSVKRHAASRRIKRINVTTDSPVSTGVKQANVKPSPRKKLVTAVNVKSRSPLNPKYATPRMIKDSKNHKSPSPRKRIGGCKLGSPGQNGIDPDASKEARMMEAVRRRMKRKVVNSCEMGIQTSPRLFRQ